MDIKKIRKAVMASMGVMSTMSDTKIKELWNRLDAEKQETFLKKVKGDKNVTSIDRRKVSSSSTQSRRDGKPPNIPVPLS